MLAVVKNSIPAKRPYSLWERDGTNPVLYAQNVRIPPSAHPSFVCRRLKWKRCVCIFIPPGGKEIRGPFVNNAGIPRCLSCQPKSQICARCGTVFRFFHSLPILDIEAICSRIETQIEGSFLQIGTNAYHSKCFTCHLCSSQMGTNEIFGYLVPAYF